MRVRTESRQGEEWYRPRRVLSRKLLPLSEVLAYVDVMDQVADDFIQRLCRVRRQLSHHHTDDISTSLEHELQQWALECTLYTCTRCTPLCG